MPPRKSTGRQAGATPVRETRASSLATGETPLTKPRQSGRKPAASVTSDHPRRPGPNRTVVHGESHLPDVQTQASYAYGANKGPVMPETLATENRNSIAAMAGHIEEAISEEDQEELEQQNEDDEEGDEIVVETPDTEDPRDNSQLSDVPEEDSESEPPEQSSPPSNFPSDLPDQSYNWERNRRAVRRVQPVLIQAYPPRPAPPRANILKSTSGAASRSVTAVSASMRYVADVLVEFWHSLQDRLVVLAHTARKSIRKMPLPAIGTLLATGLGLLLAMGVLSTSICFIYGRLGCDMNPTSSFGQIIHTGLQTLCGGCQSFSGPLDLSNIAPGDVSKISTTLDSINKKVHELERRLSYRIDSKYASLDSELATLKQQQAALTNHLADHVDSQSGPSSGYVASPLIPKINFFAPSNGAVVNLVKTSPTKDRVDGLALRVLKRCFGVVKQQANPPMTALVAWQDVGDCWCAANAKSGDFVRLAISTKEMLYPVELVIEHLPASGNLGRASTPREIELWADFSHFNDEEWQVLKLFDRQEGNVLGPTYARIGSMKYDASGSSSHVQSFALNINQYDSLHYAKGFVLRVTNNHGGENVCLYRVRLHGQPIAAPNGGMVDHWYEQQGYVEGE